MEGERDKESERDRQTETERWREIYLLFWLQNNGPSRNLTWF